MAYALNLIDVLPELQEQYKWERNEKAKTALEFYIDLMRQGYHLEKVSQEEFTVTITKPDRLIMDFYSKEEIETRGILSIIEEMQQEDD